MNFEKKIAFHSPSDCILFLVPRLLASSFFLLPYPSGLFYLNNKGFTHRKLQKSTLRGSFQTLINNKSQFYLILDANFLRIPEIVGRCRKMVTLQLLSKIKGAPIFYTQWIHLQLTTHLSIYLLTNICIFAHRGRYMIEFVPFSGEHCIQ